LTRRKFDPDFRERAVRLVQETGRPVAQVARDLGVNAQTLRNWVNAEHRRHSGDSGVSSEAGLEKLARVREEVPALGTAADVRESRAPVASLGVVESQAPTVPLDVVDSRAPVASLVVAESQAPTVPLDVVESPAPVVPPDVVESPAPVVPPDVGKSQPSAPGPYVRRYRAARDRLVALASGGLGPYLGALALIAVLVPLHGLWAAQVLLVPLLLVVPGAILLRALRVPVGAVSSFPVYVPCASLIVLLGSGLLVDLVGPLIAVAAPIRAAPLLVGLEAVCLALLAKSRNMPSSVAIPWRPFASLARLAWPFILPLVAAAGALRLNNGHSNGVAAIATAACVVVLVTAIVRAPRLDKSLLAVILYATSLALMWSVSLRGALVPGFDIATEYYKLHQTVVTGIWHPTHHNDAYGAMLSVTVMPAELHFLSGVPDLMVFKVVYPAIGALLPVAVFGLARRILPHRWAFAAATFVVAQAFSSLPVIARQEIAMVLFAALIAAMLDARIQRRSQWALVALLGLAMAASHYSTTYVAITLIGLMIPLQWVVSWFREVPRVTGAIAIAFVVALAGAFIWYGPVTSFNYGLGPLLHTIEAQGFKVLPNRAHGGSLLSAYLQGNTAPPISAGQYARQVHAAYASQRPYITPLPDAGRPLYALHNAAVPGASVRSPVANSALSALYLILQELANLLGALGALLMVLERRSFTVARQAGLLAVAAVAMLTVMKLSATVADFYNWERALLQAQVVLAIALCWPLYLLDSRRRRHHKSILAAAVASFAVVLICTSGLANVALGGGALGGGENVNLANSGEAFNRYYLTTPELASAGWLGRVARPGELVYADRYAQLRLFAMTGSSLGLVGDVTPLTLNQHAWVYADRTNVLNHSAEVLFNNSAVTYRFPAGFLNANYDLVYTNGSSEVFRR
jgi:uncharacterized membrane protein/transposase-like protein